ncbi:nucleoside triphosphate pyrophosphohydrolase [Alicyclobacillus pomorum]|jgi:predicted house-cleaning noncanonical NTP pyrophosphatase (MazG superfamily)|uniref:nucleoside triphosphate pyrophosphohydrolase n=1 Tax=Alicyclobacillus pomorum TaxID=204470 RepID=UPI00047B026F|nr:nucleoside triphosphate pyrophosphohydrolase [Alicyclobacillus pomorum]
MSQDSRPVNASNASPNRRPSVTVYNRLVRDKMPEIIEAMGNIAVYQILDDTAFRDALLSTISRSAAQFSETESLESLADLLDCIDIWLEMNDLTMEEVEKARAERVKRCGNFHQKMFLEVVADGASSDALQLREFRC